MADFEPFGPEGEIQDDSFSGLLLELLAVEFISWENLMVELTPESYDAYRVIKANDFLDKLEELYGNNAEFKLNRVIDEDAPDNRVEVVTKWAEVYNTASRLWGPYNLLAGFLRSAEVSILEPYYREKASEALGKLEKWYLEFRYLLSVIGRDGEAAELAMAAKYK